MVLIFGLLSPSAVAGAILATFIAKLYLSAWLEKRRVRRLEAINGCEPIPYVDTKLPLAIDFAYDRYLAAKNHVHISTMVPRLWTERRTVRVSPLGRNLIFTLEPENIKTILSTNFDDYELTRRRKWLFTQLLGSGIFASDGAQWAHSRAMIRPNFTRAQVADLTMFERHFQHLLPLMPKDGSTVELQDLFFKMTMDTATEFLFGKSTGMLTPETQDPLAQSFVEGYTYGTEWINDYSSSGGLTGLIPDRKHKKAIKDVWTFVNGIISEAIAAKDNPTPTTTDTKQPYVFLHEMLNETRDPYILASEALNVLLAGRDTTASCLSFTMRALAQHPSVWSKLRSEILSTVGPSKPPTYEQLKSLKYLRYILNESLRLWPIVPANAKQAIRDNILPHGGGPDGKSPIFIPRGHLIIWSVYALQRLPEYFGPEDPNAFIPERWEKLRPTSWEYLPFNGGPRICVGQQYALAEAGYVIVRLAQTFAGGNGSPGRLELRDEQTEWREWLTLTMANLDGCKVAFVGGEKEKE